MKDVEEWARSSFRKVVCKVTDEEFESFKVFSFTEEGRVMTESGLSGQEVAIVFKPRKEWRKQFKFLRLYK